MNSLVGAKSSCLTSFRPKMSARVYIALFAIFIAVVVTVSAQDEDDAFNQVYNWRYEILKENLTFVDF